MKISIVCVGKIKEKFYRDAIQEYSKRLGRYCTLQILEVQDEKTPDGSSQAEEEQIREKEGGRLLKKIPDQAFCIALAIQGKKTDSIGFSEMMEKIMLNGKDHLVFVIGGSLGLSRSVLARADQELSFSDMTFPHQLMRVILLEQVYRAFRIRNHEPYHK